LDRDGDGLTYSITRVGNTAVIENQPFPANDLVENIRFDGDQMTITLVPNATGTTVIDLRAFDGTFPVTDTFTLDVVSVPDAPVATPDGYVVAVGSTLTISDAGSGLLRNDTDADGDPITVDLASVTATTRGTLSVNADGTFTYVNNSGVADQTDSFTYRAVDSTGRFSDPVTVTITLGRSRFQNPIATMASDVTADGFVTALDALRVINLMNRMSTSSSSIPTSSLGFDPPDYVDVDGDGSISAFDALLVINALNRQGNGGGGEGEAAASVTTSYATVTPNLATRNVVRTDTVAETSEPTAGSIGSESSGVESASDVALASFEGVDSNRTTNIADGLAASETTGTDADQVDAAIGLLLDDPMF